ncbi:MAG: hypothetical protein WD200_03190 [Candidatus Andersenbacteria bacterium]
MSMKLKALLALTFIVIEGQRLEMLWQVDELTSDILWGEVWLLVNTTLVLGVGWLFIYAGEILHKAQQVGPPRVEPRPEGRKDFRQAA